jgi:predicted DsbA family dithiol-disulfide isomerase
MSLSIAIYSDVIYPWCWIGKRRLEQALTTLAPHPFTVTWHPYQLNPDMPLTGMARAAYRQRKFGSAEYAAALDARVTQVAQQDGLAFDLAAQQRTPNTLLAHRLIWLAGQHGVQNAVVEALFSAYFSAGMDIGDVKILTGITNAAVPEHPVFTQEQLAHFLAGDDGLTEVQSDEAHMRALGVDGVPLYILNGAERLSGAQPVAVFNAYLAQLINDRRT